MGLLQRYGLMGLARVGVIKKLLAEFLQFMTMDKSETVEAVVRRYPIIDIVLIVIIRALLSNYYKSTKLLDISVKM